MNGNKPKIFVANKHTKKGTGIFQTKMGKLFVAYGNLVFVHGFFFGNFIATEFQQ